MIIEIVIDLDFHPAKWALWLVDSWSRAPDQIQMYPDRDTIAQLLPTRNCVLYASMREDDWIASQAENAAQKN